MKIYANGKDSPFRTFPIHQLFTYERGIPMIELYIDGEKVFLHEDYAPPPTPSSEKHTDAQKLNFAEAEIRELKIYVDKIQTRLQVLEEREGPGVPLSKDDEPKIVACEEVDADGRRHAVVRVAVPLSSPIEDMSVDMLNVWNSLIKGINK